MKEFVSICKKSQSELKKYVTKKLSETHNKVIEANGYVYAQGSFPVLLVAHLDTVHEKLPAEILYDTETMTISSSNGIGGDDRCGVYMIFEIIKHHNCSVLFCEDEEIGGKGADAFTESELAKGLEFNYIIELDRKGENDAVFYDCDNEDFEKFITQDFYKTAYGSFSDISIIAPVLKCAAVNLSCGYYKAHTKDEYVIMPQMVNGIKEVCKILERTTDENKYEYIEAKNRYFNWEGYGFDLQESFCIEYYENGMQFEIISAKSVEEAIGKLFMLHTSICYDQVVDIYPLCDDEDDVYSYTR